MDTASTLRVGDVAEEAIVTKGPPKAVAIFAAVVVAAVETAKAAEEGARIELGVD